MNSSPAPPREIAVPVSVFEALRSELEKDAGTLQTVRAMHHAGYQAGLAAAASLHTEAGGDPLRLPESTFWSVLSDYFTRRGWGSFTHRAAHPGVAILTTHDWAEATPDATDSDAACSFSAGFLSGLISQLVGEAVAVLEVTCRSRGDGTCAFAFGSETAIHELYGKMLEGADLESALRAL